MINMEELKPYLNKEYVKQMYKKHRVKTIVLLVIAFLVIGEE